MTNFITEQLDRDGNAVEYAVSVNGERVKIVSHGPEGIDVFEVRATRKADVLHIVSIEGDADRLFTEWVQQRIEGAIDEETEGTGDEFFESDGGPLDEAYAGQIRDRWRNEAFGRELAAAVRKP